MNRNNKCPMCRTVIHANDLVVSEEAIQKIAQVWTASFPYSPLRILSIPSWFRFSTSMTSLFLLPFLSLPFLHSHLPLLFFLFFSSSSFLFFSFLISHTQHFHEKLAVVRKDMEEEQKYAEEKAFWYEQCISRAPLHAVLVRNMRKQGKEREKRRNG